MIRYTYGDDRLPKRFWNKVELCPIRGCWLWTGGASSGGYGSFFWYGKTVIAHRLIYDLLVENLPRDTGIGPIGTLVIHLCDTTLCVNPSHLRTGSQQDNMDDMANKNRASRLMGEASWMSLLTERDVLEIRELCSSSQMTQKEIASRFGVIHQTISMIHTRQAWKHI